MYTDKTLWQCWIMDMWFDVKDKTCNRDQEKIHKTIYKSNFESENRPM